MLTDIASVGFKVENFNRSNMEKLEASWPNVRRALLQTVELASSFGLNGQTLRADSALLPVAYYLFQKKAPDNYITHTQYEADRQALRGWLIRSLLKASGIWGSGLDTLLASSFELPRVAAVVGRQANAGNALSGPLSFLFDWGLKLRAPFRAGSCGHFRGAINFA
jgi:hypothetical protein